MMKVLLMGWLAVCWAVKLQAQPTAGQPYADARKGYRLVYPPNWQVAEGRQPGDVVFYTGNSPQTAQAAATLSIRPLPDNRKDLDQLASGQADSVWRAVRRLPRSRVARIEQHDAGSYQEVRYDYTFAPDGAVERTHVLGRRLWRGGYEFQLEYRAPARQEGRNLAAGQQLLASLALTGPGLPSRRTTEQGCDDKMYGIVALRFHDGQWEDDCRTIHEFLVADPAAPPKVHARVLPFQSYALAKGFDNCLYSVTKAPTDAPELVYRYNPATRQGDFTAWQLPAQGPENVWISAATDQRGDLYFITSDANLLVKVSPATNAVRVVWSADPVRQAPYYPAIGFAKAGTHANFCLTDADSLYQVYSTDGALLKVSLATQKPAPDLLPLEGLPNRGGYSDLLLQTDRAGRRRLYLAGPKALYEVDVARRRATRVRRGTYTDLAGCNLFLPPPPAAAALPTAATWRGRVLDAATLQPLPQARFRLSLGKSETTVPLTSEAAFAFPAEVGKVYAAHLELPGYLAADTAYLTLPGPYVQDIVLRPLAVGTTQQLDKVQFEQGQAVLLPSSFPALNQLVNLLTRNPGMTIELRGHTDNVGDPQKNVVLSEERVAAVKDYLVSRGIAEGRISGLGLGGTEPRASNEQESTRQLNRRVEFRVTGVQ
ncbi:OmpA family protein [Hymenobacter busanensis]|nr:OmpA family protein [Hymenobacter busanensis]QHJ06215.1 OmpA family protein [Hymenobacter busanensis]